MAFYEARLVRRETVAEGTMAFYFFKPSGPPPMTMTMQQMLEEIGIGEQAMRYEEFYGY